MAKNRHGQPFSKKQKKASRMMMKNRRGFTPTQASFEMPSLGKTGMLSALAGLLGLVGRQRRP